MLVLQNMKGLFIFQKLICLHHELIQYFLIFLLRKPRAFPSPFSHFLYFLYKFLVLTLQINQAHSYSLKCHFYFEIFQIESFQNDQTEFQEIKQLCNHHVLIQHIFILFHFFLIFLSFISKFQVNLNIELFHLNRVNLV